MGYSLFDPRFINKLKTHISFDDLMTLSSEGKRDMYASIMQDIENEDLFNNSEFAVQNLQTEDSIKREFEDIQSIEDMKNALPKIW